MSPLAARFAINSPRKQCFHSSLFRSSHYRRESSAARAAANPLCSLGASLIAGETFQTPDCRIKLAQAIDCIGVSWATPFGAAQGQATPLPKLTAQPPTPRAGSASKKWRGYGGGLAICLALAGCSPPPPLPMGGGLVLLAIGMAVATWLLAVALVWLVDRLVARLPAAGSNPPAPPGPKPAPPPNPPPASGAGL